MSDTGNRRPPRGGADQKPFRKPQGAAGSGERRYNKPAAPGQTVKSGMASPRA
jgi:hypothetical protein